MAYNLLKGKTGIIFGALDEKSIAWQVALKANEEGAKFTLSNTPSRAFSSTKQWVGQSHVQRGAWKK